MINKNRRKWAATILRQFNAWRRDIGDENHEYCPTPKSIGVALDIAISALDPRKPKKSRKTKP